jgi:hypothetical protein
MGEDSKWGAEVVGKNRHVYIVVEDPRMLGDLPPESRGKLEVLYLHLMTQTIPWMLPGGAHILHSRCYP